MKRIIIVMGFIPMIIMAFKSSAQTNTQFVFSSLTNGEDTLNVSKNCIPRDTGLKYLSWENTCLFIVNSTGDTTHLNSFIQKIDTLELDTLHMYAHNLVPGSIRHFITALRITYGVDNSHHFLIFFSPLALIQLNVIPPSAMYTIIPSTNYFIFDTVKHALVPVLSNTFNTDTANFRSDIRMSQSITSPHPVQFNSEADSMGSATSVILSFQEIFRFILQNDSAMKVMGKSCNYINIFSTCVKYPVFKDGVEVTLMKEDIMLGLISKYEDLGHLCPPDCGTTEYQLLNTQTEELKKSH